MNLLKNFKFSPRTINLFLLLAVLTTVTLVIFYSRQIFYFTYEPEYYENLYYHSQWNIAGSERGISDGMLYKFVGYRLVQGENPFYLNFEAPPFGKYLYGLAEYSIGNPYWISLILYLSTVLLFYFLSKELFKEKKLVLLSLLLFVTTPFIATQVRDTMLDLPLTCFYLANVFFLVKYLVKPKLFLLALAGIFLGLATGTKIGVYTPAALLLGLILIFWQSKTINKLLNPIFYLVVTLAGYVISYIAYFIRHPNPIPWLKLHQKQLDFYLGNGSNVDYLNQWRGIFLNSYEGWWKMGKTSFGDWSPVLPLGVIASLLVFIFSIKKKEKAWVYISGLTIIFLIVNSLIDFFPRYLMPVVPGFCLLIAYFFRKDIFGKKFWWILIILALLNLPFFSSSLIKKNYQSSTEASTNFIAKRAYRELYRSIDPEQRKSMKEEEFINTLENFYQSLRVKKIEVVTNEITKDGNNINASIRIKYLTDYGELGFDSILHFKDLHNQTVLEWKWDYLWPNFSADKKIVVEKGEIPLSMIRKDGQVIALPGEANQIYIITRHVSLPATLDPLSELTGKSTLEVGDILRYSIPDDFPRFVDVLKGELGEEGVKKALEVKGVKLYKVNYMVPAPGVSDGTYKTIREIYQKKPELFYTNANIYFDVDGQREYILKADPNKNGVTLDL